MIGIIYPNIIVLKWFQMLFFLFAFFSCFYGQFKHDWLEKSRYLVEKPDVFLEKSPSPEFSIDDPSLEERAQQVMFDGLNNQSHLYIQVDKPMYRPSETVWIKTIDLDSGDLSGNKIFSAIKYSLINPRGIVLNKKNVAQDGGAATNDFFLPTDLPGGSYTIRATTSSGVSIDRPIIVTSTHQPKIEKKLEFLREAYGPGDEVYASISISDVSGPIKNHSLQAIVQIDGNPLPKIDFSTDENGEGLVQFVLPEKISSPSGIVTVLVEKSGVTESITRPIPLVLNQLSVSFFPEGGDLVAGLPGRVYFEARNADDKPADISGRLVDDEGTFFVIGKGKKRLIHDRYRQVSGHRIPLPIARLNIQLYHISGIVYFLFWRNGHF